VMRLKMEKQLIGVALILLVLVLMAGVVDSIRSRPIVAVVASQEPNEPNEIDLLCARIGLLERTNINLEKDIGHGTDKAVKLQKELNQVREWNKYVKNEIAMAKDPNLIFDVEQNCYVPISWTEELNVPVEPNFTDTVAKTIGSVVHIYNNTGGWQGSGVAIAPDLIVTARHVVEDGVDFTITDNNGVEVKATRAASSKKYDVGFIKLDDPNLIPAEFGSIENCKLGQQVYAVGSPYGKINFNSVSLGIISGLDRNWDELNSYTGEKYGWEIAFTTDSAGHPGSSGCPIFTMDGKVRGILVGGFSPVLISVMPCDLFLSNIKEINQMFLMDEYQKEEAVDYAEEAWGY